MKKKSKINQQVNAIKLRNFIRYKIFGITRSFKILFKIKHLWITETSTLYNQIVTLHTNTKPKDLDKYIMGNYSQLLSFDCNNTQ